MLKIATGIETQLWYSIIEYLKKSDWIVVSEYQQFDKGIDFDLYKLAKENKTIFLAWDNWFEGEIKCSEELLKILEKEFNTTFKFGEPENLSDEILDKLKQFL